MANDNLSSEQQIQGMTRTQIMMMIGGLLLAVVVGSVSLYLSTRDQGETTQAGSFEECAAQVESQILESYPRQCVTAEGVTFTETIPDTSDNNLIVGGGQRALDGCIIGGCNSEICADEEMMSPCIYKDEFSCYQNLTCKKLDDGECGWEETDEFRQCLDEKSGSF